MQEPVLRGRAEDLAAAGTVLASAAAGRGGSLVYVGTAPGVGRSRLLAGIAAGAVGWTVLAAPGYADEAGRSGAAVRRLIAPLGGLSPVAAASFLRGPVSVAELAGLLRSAARRRPVLCLVDDAEWVDPASWGLLRRAMRRLGDAPVALVGSSAGWEAAAGFPGRRLGPLDDDASRALLAEIAPETARDVIAYVLEMAEGNPGVLGELAGVLGVAQRRGSAALPECLPADTALGYRLRAGVAGLPARTRDLLLLLAAPPMTPLPDVSELRDLAPAEAAGLVAVDGGSLVFRPPALAAIVYHDAPVSVRRAAHLRLAEIVQGLPALMHRAAAASGPDDALAARLRADAALARPRMAALAHRQAARLSTDPAPALLDAARAAWLAGRPQDAAPMLRTIARGGSAGTTAGAGTVSRSASVRARARGLTAELRLRGAPEAARDVLLDVAAELLPHDRPGALDALLLAGEAGVRSGDAGRFAALARLVPGTDLAARHVAGLAALLSGADDRAFAEFRAVLDLAPAETDPARLIPAAMAGVLVGRDREAARHAFRAADLARTAGAHALVPAALEAAAYAEMAAGRYPAAAEAALDGVAAARRAARPDLADTHLALLAVLTALTGDRPAAEHRARAATGRHDDAGELAGWAYALLDLVDGRPAPAAARLAAIAAGRGSALLRVAVVPHLLEAAGPAAPLDDVAAAFDRWAGRTGEAAWLAMRARCRALCSTDPAAADDHFREALRLESTGFPRAHTELLYGRRLRRGRRPTEARGHLRHAAETFRLFGADAWAEQAARELRAAGDRTPSAPPLTGPPLTAQQERIAGLVAAGATNREVAEQLHLSPRTVDHHLRNVFARLGVRSRTELARRLAA